MATFYLDIDDEITSAAARIRQAEDTRIALVLPAGSRIATSRINFRLLAREAQGRSRRLAIVAPEASARALAASAGLPVFASVVEYEDALADERPAAPAPTAEGGPAPAEEGIAAGAAVAGAAVAAALSGAIAAAAAPGSAAAAPPSVAAAPGSAAAASSPPGTGLRDQARRVAPEPAAAPVGSPAGAAVASAPAAEPVRPVGPSTGLGAAAPPRRPARGRGRLVVVAVLALLLLGGLAAGVGAYVFLPTATVTVIPATKAIGPVDLTITVDPGATEPDPEAGTVPGTIVEFPVAVEGTFKSTGKRVEEEKASGSVRWLNCDQTSAYTIPRGTLVRTAGGVGFLTTESVLLPVAIQTGTPPNIRVECSRRAVDVVAAKAGPEANVDAGTITRVPGAYNPVVIKVTNPRAASGGSREEFPKVTQKDIDAALVTLDGMLDEQLASVADAPPGMPAGSVVVPGTAQRGEATPTPDPATLLGQEVEEFTLGLSATGTVLTVAPADARTVAAATLGASVPADYQLDPASVEIEVGVPLVEGEQVTVPATGTATATRVVDEADVRGLVAGRTPAEAEELLAPYGTAEVTVWPDWVPTVTSIDSRLTVTIVGGSGASPSPGGSPVPGGSAASPPPAVSPAASTLSPPSPSPDASVTPAP
jgi:hypothetical protein